ncbi:hypothetical protein CCACVL1_29783 [Corchorus capsularis]|uniref:Uncharacterized protein n=1 Tax=Corchorus capsularis TaxID=210143 RepID=A0A1R3G0F0_COCAP|nr:hypothetical protein CCACVL1_29783 [Corchorus capsularis]
MKPQVAYNPTGRRKENEGNSMVTGLKRNYHSLENPAFTLLLNKLLCGPV